MYEMYTINAWHILCDTYIIYFERQINGQLTSNVNNICIFFPDSFNSDGYALSTSGVAEGMKRLKVSENNLRIRGD